MKDAIAVAHGMRQKGKEHMRRMNQFVGTNTSSTFEFDNMTDRDFVAQVTEVKRTHPLHFILILCSFVFLVFLFLSSYC